MWAATEVRNRISATTPPPVFSDYEVYTQSIVEYYKNMYQDAPSAVWDYVGKVIRETLNPKDQAQSPTYSK